MTHRSGRVADEALTAGAVARRLGVAVTTLRTWHQRYGLGPSQHVPGQHRRYTTEDLDRLQVMRRLTAQGVAPAEAAAWARRVPVPIDVPAPELLPLESEPEAPAARDGGGHAIRTGRAGPAARGLARAAIRMDAPGMRDILETTVAARGVVAAWEEVIMPVLIGVGERYAATKRFIAVEHILSRGVTEVLSAVTRPPSDQAPQVLLAAADEEQHTLPLEALAAALAQHGVPSRLLGARVPVEALAEAIARTGPAVLVVWSQLPGSADHAQWTQLLADRRPLLVAAAGPGWQKEKLPEDVTLLGSLMEAVQLITAVVAPR
jgi:MerR family transcriptional regulator, light-induced transcriptional regulator